VLGLQIRHQTLGIAALEMNPLPFCAAHLDFVGKEKEVQAVVEPLRRVSLPHQEEAVFLDAMEGENEFKVPGSTDPRVEIALPYRQIYHLVGQLRVQESSSIGAFNTKNG